MSIHTRSLIAVPLAVIALALAGCGGSSNSGSGSASNKSEAASAATGDIPDNQVFLTFKDPKGFSLKYPEGWTRRGAGTDLTFNDKENTIHVVLGGGPSQTPASVTAALTKLKTSDPTLKAQKAQIVSLPAGKVVKVTYSRLGSKDPVTGKRPLLITDRYVYAKGGKVATLDLGTPKGVDNVDAYRMISQSFTWR